MAADGVRRGRRIVQGASGGGVAWLCLLMSAAGALCVEVLRKRRECRRGAGFAAVEEGGAMARGRPGAGGAGAFLVALAVAARWGEP